MNDRLMMKYSTTYRILEKTLIHSKTIIVRALVAELERPVHEVFILSTFYSGPAMLKVGPKRSTGLSRDSGLVQIRLPRYELNDSLSDKTAPYKLSPSLYSPYYAA